MRGVVGGFGTYNSIKKIRNKSNDRHKSTIFNFKKKLKKKRPPKKMKLIKLGVTLK